jgi:hypothetical protein
MLIKVAKLKKNVLQKTLIFFVGNKINWVKFLVFNYVFIHLCNPLKCVLSSLKSLLYLFFWVEISWPE